MGTSIQQLVQKLVARIGSPLRIKDPRARQEAIEVYCQQHPRKCDDVLLKAVDDPDYFVRERAVDLLTDRLTPSVLTPFLERLSRVPGQQWRAISIAKALDSGLGGEMAQLLIERTDINLRAMAVAILAYVPAEFAVSALRRIAAGDAEPIELRIKAIDALTNHDGNDVVEALRGIAETGPYTLRQHAIIGLGKLAQQETLIAWLGDPTLAAALRASCLEGLSLCLDADHADIFLPYLTDPDTLLRVAAARAIGELYATEAVLPLIHHLGSGRTRTRQRAVDALTTLVEEEIITPMDVVELTLEESQHPVDALINLLVFSPRHFVEPVREGLATMDWVRELPELAELAQHGSRAGLRALEQALRGSGQPTARDLAETLRTRYLARPASGDFEVFI